MQSVSEGNHEMNEKVFCIVVTFNPDAAELLKNVRSILENHVALVVVDNGSSNHETIGEQLQGIPDVAFIPLHENRGIAAAQNVGIEYAYEHGGGFFWLSDQDTFYPADYIRKALEFIESLDEKEKSNLGVVGPVFYDNNRGAVQPVVVFSPFTRKYMAKEGANVVSHMIASGMVIPRKAIDIVGYKNEGLFIDWVDMEWCWRASYLHDLKLLVCGDLVINHSLGDSHRNILGKKIIFRSPFRHYYMVRNAVSLAVRAKYLPWAVSGELFAKSIAWSLVLPVFSRSGKGQHLKAVATGFYDGLAGR